MRNKFSIYAVMACLALTFAAAIPVAVMSGPVVSPPPFADITLTVQQIARNTTGLSPSYTGSLSTSNTYHAANDGRLFLHVKKTSGPTGTLTMVPTATLAGLTVGNLVVTITGTTGDIMVGPFPQAVFGDTLSWTYSDIAGLTHAAIRP
jgi:hypothetical protein